VGCKTTRKDGRSLPALQKQERPPLRTTKGAFERLERNWWGGGARRRQRKGPRKTRSKCLGRHSKRGGLRNGKNIPKKRRKICKKKRRRKQAPGRTQRIENLRLDTRRLKRVGKDIQGWGEKGKGAKLLKKGRKGAIGEAKFPCCPAGEGGEGSRQEAIRDERISSNSIAEGLAPVTSAFVGGRPEKLRQGFPAKGGRRLKKNFWKNMSGINTEGIQATS